jgi:hypothetical protein
VLNSTFHLEPPNFVVLLVQNKAQILLSTLLKSL